MRATVGTTRAVEGDERSLVLITVLHEQSRPRGKCHHQAWHCGYISTPLTTSQHWNAYKLWQQHSWVW